MIHFETMTQDELYDLAGECGDESGSPSHVNECVPCQAYEVWVKRDQAAKKPEPREFLIFHEYYLQAHHGSGRYQKFPFDTAMFLLKGDYIKFERTIVHNVPCHYFAKD